jgi:hypothetical protein
MVHLSGAGGMEMPAIVQTIMLVICCNESGRFVERRPLVASRGGFLVAGTVIAILFAACLYTATLPVLARKSLVSSGDAAISLGGDENAERFYPRRPPPIPSLRNLREAGGVVS